jgi:predicted acyl esterase
VPTVVDAVLRVLSSAKDSDFAVKLVDVAPGGTAWIVGDTILRARYRDASSGRP